MKKLLILLLTVILLTACDDKKDEERAKGISESQFGYNFKTLNDALKQDYGVECIYIDETGERIKALIKGSDIKTMGAEDKNKNYVILTKGNLMWMWDNAKKIGSQTDLSNLNEDNNVTMRDIPIRSAADVINVVETYRQSCKTVNLTAADFKVPADITIVIEE